MEMITAQTSVTKDANEVIESNGIQLLGDLQLAIVGGGIGEATFG